MLFFQIYKYWVHRFYICGFHLQFDYHDLSLYDARDKMCDDIIEAYEIGEKEVQLIHGYHKGLSIKNYIWSQDGLQKDLKIIKPEIRIHKSKGENKGVTRIIFIK